MAVRQVWLRLLTFGSCLYHNLGMEEEHVSRTSGRKCRMVFGDFIFGRRDERGSRVHYDLRIIGVMAGRFMDWCGLFD